MTTNIDRLLSLHPLLKDGKSSRSAVVTRLRTFFSNAELTDLRDLFGGREPTGEPSRPSEEMLRRLAHNPSFGMQSASWMVLFDVLAAMVCGYAEKVDSLHPDVPPKANDGWGIQVSAPEGVRVRATVDPQTRAINITAERSDPPIPWNERADDQLHMDD